MTIFREYVRGLTHVNADGTVWTDWYDVTCFPPPDAAELARIQESMASLQEDDAPEEPDAPDDAPDEGDW